MLQDNESLDVLRGGCFQKALMSTLSKVIESVFELCRVLWQSHKQKIHERIWREAGTGVNVEELARPCTRFFFLLVRFLKPAHSCSFGQVETDGVERGGAVSPSSSPPMESFERGRYVFRTHFFGG